MRIARGPPAEEAGGRRRGDALRRERPRLMQRLLGREVGGKQNILVLNDEAHHAYRIRAGGGRRRRGGRRGARRGARRRARLRGDRLDRRARPDPQAPPDQLLRRPLGDAVLPRAGGRGHEPDLPVGRQRLRPDRRDRVGLVKIPQLARLDPTGEEQAAYFNIWRWIMSKLTGAERGGKRANPKPEAVLRCAEHPIRLLARRLGRGARGVGDEATRSGRRCSSSSARTRGSPR